MATIVRYNIGGTDLVQDASASSLLWLPRFPLKLAWNLTQASAIKDRRLTDMGPSLCWTCGRTNSILSVQCAQCVSAWLLNCKWCLRPATVAVCKIQHHGMSRYSANPALSAWHTMHPLRLCRLRVTWDKLSQTSRVAHVIWFVTSVTCNACDLVCDEYHMWRMLRGLWWVSHVTRMILVCDECHM